MSMVRFRQDLLVNKGIMSRLIVGVYRLGHWTINSVHLPIARQLLWMMYKVLDLCIVKSMGGAEIDPRCRIGGGLRLPHGGNGIVIHPDAVLGNNVTIFHQVTLGVNDFDSENIGAPNVGDRVFIGAGAKLIGPIWVGHDAKIGANAVVIADVPASTTSVGVPARVITSSHQ